MKIMIAVLLFVCGAFAAPMPEQQGSLGDTIGNVVKTFVDLPSNAFGVAFGPNSGLGFLNPANFMRMVSGGGGQMPFLGSAFGLLNPNAALSQVTQFGQGAAGQTRGLFGTGQSLFNQGQGAGLGLFNQAQGMGQGLFGQLQGAATSAFGTTQGAATNALGLAQNTASQGFSSLNSAGMSAAQKAQIGQQGVTNLVQALKSQAITLPQFTEQIGMAVSAGFLSQSDASNILTQVNQAVSNAASTSQALVPIA